MYLCISCGAEILESEKCCSKCGAVNYRNPEILAKAISENINYNNKVKKANYLFWVMKTIGIICIVFGLLIDVIFAITIANGDGLDMISILPIGGIVFSVGLVITFVFKTY